MAVLIVAATAAFASSMAEPNRRSVARALPLLPIAWLAAAFNAFAEEVCIGSGRSGPLAVLSGRGPASAILAVWFGLGHVYKEASIRNHGFVMGGWLGLLFGKAMIDTRGLCLPWALHFSADAAIYTSSPWPQ